MGNRSQLPEGVKTRIECSGRISGNIQYSPDGKELAVASDKGIWIYNARTGAEVALLSGHRGDVLAIAYAPNGKTLASAGRDETVRLWDAETGRFLPTLRGHYWEIKGVAISTDRKTVASADKHGTILLWDWKKLAKSQR